MNYSSLRSTYVRETSEKQSDNQHQGQRATALRVFRIDQLVTMGSHVQGMWRAGNLFKE